MTLIIAAIKKGKGYIASDSQGSNKFTKSIYKNNKIFKKGDMLIGGCGSFKQLQLLEYNFTIPERAIGDGTDDYMLKKFVPELKRFFKDNNVISTKDGVDENNNAEFIIVYDNRIFILQSDLALLEPKSDFVCIGSGMYHAYAAIKGMLLADPNISISKLFNEALKITSDVVMSVGGKLHILDNSTIKGGRDERYKRKRNE